MDATMERERPPPVVVAVEPAAMMIGSINDEDGDGFGGHQGGDEAGSLLVKTILMLQREIDSRIKQGGKVHAKSLFNPSACISELDIAPVVNKDLRFAPAEHREVHLRNLVRLLLDRLNAVALLTRTQCSQRVTAVMADDHYIPPALQHNTDEPHELGAAFTMLQQTCDAEAHVIAQLVENESRLQCQLGDMALSKSAKCEEIDLLRNIIEKTDPSSGAHSRRTTAESREEERKRLKQWKALFEKIRLAAERRILCIDSSDCTPCCLLTERTQTASQTEPMPAEEYNASVEDFQEKIHDVFACVLGLDLHTVVLPKAVQDEWFALLKKDPPKCEQHSFTVLQFIKIILKESKEVVTAERIKRAEADKRCGEAEMRVKNTDSLIQHEIDRGKAELHEAVTALKHSHEKELRATSAAHSSAMEKVVATCAQFKETCSRLEGVLSEKVQECAGLREAVERLRKETVTKEKSIEELSQKLASAEKIAAEAATLQQNFQRSLNTAAGLSEEIEHLKEKNSALSKEREELFESYQSQKLEFEKLRKRETSELLAAHQESEAVLLAKIKTLEERIYAKNSLYLSDEERFKEETMQLKAECAEKTQRINELELLVDSSKEQHERVETGLRQRISELEGAPSGRKLQEDAEAGKIVADAQVLAAENKRMKRELKHAHTSLESLKAANKEQGMAAKHMALEAEQLQDRCSRLESELQALRDAPVKLTPFKLHEPTALWQVDDLAMSANNTIPSSSHGLEDQQHHSIGAPLSDPRGYDILQIPVNPFDGFEDISAPPSRGQLSRRNDSSPRTPGAVSTRDGQEEALYRPPSRLASRDEEKDALRSRATQQRPPSRKSRPATGNKGEEARDKALAVSTEEAYMRIMRKYKQRSRNGSAKGRTPRTHTAQLPATQHSMAIPSRHTTPNAAPSPANLTQARPPSSSRHSQSSRTRSTTSSRPVTQATVEATNNTLIRQGFLLLFLRCSAVNGVPDTQLFSFQPANLDTYVAIVIVVAVIVIVVMCFFAIDRVACSWGSLRRGTFIKATAARETPWIANTTRNPESMKQQPCPNVLPFHQAIASTWFPRRLLIRCTPFLPFPPTSKFSPLAESNNRHDQLSLYSEHATHEKVSQA